jgi:hypothetical protein
MIQNILVCGKLKRRENKFNTVKASMATQARNKKKINLIISQIE